MTRKALFSIASLWLGLAAAVSSVHSAVLIPTEATWSYWTGLEAPSLEAPFWVEKGFVDASWQKGSAPFRYGDGSGGTLIEGMQNTFSTFFIRRSFQVTDPEQIEALNLHMDYDDGFALWINGRLTHQVNAPNAIQLESLATASHESGVFETFSLDKAIEYLIPGENLIAIQGFNTTLGSSDFMLHPELSYETLDAQPPVVISLDPPPGLVESFSGVDVVFNEPVTGVDAGDLTLNGQPAIQVSGTGESYRFVFDSPDAGPFTLGWVPDAGIQDLARVPNVLDVIAPDQTWQYQLLDLSAPYVARTFPAPGQRIQKFEGVEVLFSEPVLGVDAGDLLANGIPAISVEGIGAGPYRFVFPPLFKGVVNLSWAMDHGIEDHASEPNAMQANSWHHDVDAQVSYQGVMISEIMASNQSGLLDDDRERVDWIELHNSNPYEVSLKGWALSDHPAVPDQWVFGEVTMAPRSYLLVFASAKDRPGRRLGDGPHTNFQLSRAGEFLGLYSPEFPRQLVSDLGDQFPEQRMDVSYGRHDAGSLVYFASPSPGSANGGEILTRMLPEPHFSAGRGFYDQTIEVALSSSVEGAQIRYTTDDSEPTATTGMIYSGPLSLSRNTALRAAVFKPGWLPSKVVTHSYFFRVRAVEGSLPILSLTTDRLNLFGPSGIMETNPRNTNKRGRSWERPVTVEYFLADGTPAFQVDAGLRIQGGAYVRDRYDPNGGLPFSKYSFRLYFRGDYGASALSYPLIGRSPAENYKQIVLRAGMNDHSDPFVVDELVRRLSADMGQVSSQGTLVRLYINGSYKGYYNPTERIDEDFLDTWQGGQGDYDIIAQFGEIRAGTATEWNRLKQVMSRDLSVASNYQAAMALLDVDAFIDYLLLNIYVGTRDWPHNNWRAARERVDGARWRFYVWDAEWSFFNQGGSVNHNTLKTELAVNQDIANFYQSLRASATFRTRFADRVFKHFYGQGALSDEHILMRFEELRDALSATKQINNNIATTWIPRRRGYVLEHLAQEGLFLQDNVPVFSSPPGGLPSGQLELDAADAEVYYTLDGSDPLVPQSIVGTPKLLVGEQALKYAKVPTDSSIGFNWRNPDRPFDSTGWVTGRGGIGYDESTAYRSHIGLDVMSAMNERNTSIYVRIPFNVQASSMAALSYLNLKVKYDDGFVAYLNGRRIASANAPTTLQWNSAATADNPDSSAVNYQSFNVSEHIMRLRDGTNILAIQGLNRQLTSSDFLVDVILEAGTLEAGKVADGAILYQGPISVDEAMDIRARSLKDGLWSALNAGVFYPGGRISPVSFTEIMYHPPGGDAFEFVELTHFGPVAADLSRHSLEGLSYTFPAQAIMPPGATWVLASDRQINAFAERYPDVVIYDTYSGSLSDGGEKLILRDADGFPISGTRYGDDGPWPSVADGGGRSLERVWADSDPTLPSSWMASLQSGGSPGVFHPLVAQPGLVISEIMASSRSLAPQGEPDLRLPDWVELENRGPTPLPLQGIQLQDGSGSTPFVFEQQETLAPGERRVLWQKGDTDLGELPFGLNREGDMLVLSDSAGLRLDAVTFGRQLDNLSLSRHLEGQWGPGLPTPGLVNQMIVTADASYLRINEMMSDPLAGENDWVELINTHPNLPLALTGIHLQLDGQLQPGFPIAFLEPQGLLLLQQDGLGEMPSLWFDLPSTGGELALVDAAGEVMDVLDYAPQIQGHSLGRYPDGSGTFQTFASNSSPGQPNYRWNGAQVQFTEVMARNRTVRLPGMEGTPDWIELHNPSTQSVDLSGMVLRLDGKELWSLPEGLSIQPRGWFVLWMDGEDLVRRGDFDGWVIPRSLPAMGGLLEWLHPDGRLMDRLHYGLQVADQAIGVQGDQWGLLRDPSPGSANGMFAALDPAMSLRLNEWHGGEGSDWLELYHVGTQPVALGGLSLSDDLSLAGRSKHLIDALSFIGPGSTLRFLADGRPTQGANHLSFRIASQGESLGLYNLDSKPIDEISLARTPTEGGSSGRLPDGAEQVVAFSPSEASPGFPNALEVDWLSIQEFLPIPGPAQEQAIEVLNRGSQPIDLSGWSLGSAETSLNAFVLPAGSVVPAGGLLVIYQQDWLTGAGPVELPWIPSPSDRLYLSQNDSTGLATGRRVSLPMRASIAGQSIGHYETSDGFRLGTLASPTFGEHASTSLETFRLGMGAPNTGPWQGAICISEIMPGLPVGDSPSDSLEFLEWANLSSQTVLLSQATDSGLGWRLRGGIELNLSGNLDLPSQGAMVLVPFDPLIDTLQWKQFQNQWSLPAGVRVLGPYLGGLSREGETIRLETLRQVADPRYPAQPYLQWIVADEVAYQTQAPWPPMHASIGISSLRRIQTDGPGSEPQQWTLSLPTPGWVEKATSSVEQIQWSKQGIILKIFTQPEQPLLIEYADTLDQPDWLLLKRLVGNGEQIEVLDASSGNSQRFYRIRFP